MTEAVRQLHPDAQKVIVHTVRGNDLERYLHGEPVQRGAVQRPTGPGWQIAGTFQQEIADPAWGGKTYHYVVIWSEMRKKRSAR
jgi:hypothetical protein